MRSNSQLKIGFVLDDGLDAEDGVQAYILTIGTWLEKRGHEIHYLVGETNRKDIKHLHSMAKNIKVTFNGNKLTIPLPASKKRIQTLLKTEKFDILHIQVPYSPFFGAKVVSNAPALTAVVGTFHILPYGTLSEVGTRVLGRVLQRNLRRFDEQLSVSEAARDFALKTFKIPTVVVPNMVNVAAYTPAKEFKRINSKLRIVFVGRLVERKGCQYLLQALGRLYTQHPGVDFELIVCGKGPLLDELKQSVEEHNLSGKVDFKGFVSQKEKISYLQSADIAIFPAYGGESFGIVLIEAIAARAGCVIAGNNPGYASVVGGIPNALVEVRNTEHFADSLYALMTKAELRNKIHEAQQKMINNYDVNTVGKKIESIYINCKKPTTTR